MKLLLLHGPAINSSRVKLISLKEKFDANNTVVFEQGTDLTDVLNNLVSNSLFDNERLIILENPPEDFAHYTLYPIP